METSVRKIGNSTGAILPAALIKKLKIAEGDKLSVSEVDGSIVLSVIKPKYTLDELLSKCDLTASESRTPEDVEWDNIEPVGREIW